MASLIVKLHDVVTDYIKDAKDKELAGQIARDMLDEVKDIVKKHMFDPENALMFVSAKPMRILSRQIQRINRNLIRRMKPSPSCRSPWKICLYCSVPIEVFDVFDKYIQALSLQISRKQTSLTRTICINEESKVVILFLNLANMYVTALKEDDLLQTKSLRDNLKCKAVVSDEKPFNIYYSNKREILRVTMYYGCWNRHKIPQHL